MRWMAVLSLRLGVLTILWLHSAISTTLVRREVRSWSRMELLRLADAIRVMTNTSLNEGRERYGAAFQPLGHISMLHAVAVLDPRGDQGHSNWSPDQPQACFYTFHNALLTMIENSLRAIDSSLEALPYWDTLLDSPGNKYWHTNRSIYRIIGAPTGVPPTYEIVDGILPRQLVPTYPAEDDAEVPATARAVFPRPKEGWTRNHAVSNGSFTWRVQRYPAANTLNAIITIGPNSNTSMSHFPRGAQQSEDVIMSPEMVLTCRGTPALNALREKRGELNVNTYLACMDYGTYNMPTNKSCPTGHLPNSRCELQWQNAQCQQLWMHSQAHFKIGGQSTLGEAVSQPDWLSTWPYDSDLIDLATSPNDALIFILWHTNIMRHFLRWQQVSVETSPGLSRASWGFPNSSVDYPEGNEGCYLDDVINSNYPFTDPTMLPHPPKAGSAYSHREVLELFSPPHQLVDYEEVEAKRSQQTWMSAAAAVERHLMT